MAWTPDPNLFAKSLGAGIQTGSQLAQLVQDRRDRRTLSELEKLMQQGQYEQVGAGLVGMGQVGQGIGVANIPYQREQQRLQMEAQQQEAARQAQQQEFNNRLALGQFGLAQDRLGMDRARLEAAMDPNNPANAMDESWTSPVQAVDDQGNPVFVQTSNRGGVRQVEGFNPSNPIKTVDTGTEIQVIDSRTGQLISRTPKENYQEAFDTESGKGRAKSWQEAQSQLPQVEQQGNAMLGVIETLLDHPGKDSALGVIQGRMPAVVASPMNAQSVQDFRNIKAQLEGQAFLQAFESLKGGGQITEIEGRKATEAIAAIQDTQSVAEFNRQLRILQEVIAAGIDRARKSAQPPAGSREMNLQLPAVQVPAAPQPQANQTRSGIQWSIED